MPPRDAASNERAAALQEDHAEQRCGGERETDSAKREHVHLIETDPHDRPAQAPGQSQQYEQQSGVRGSIRFFFWGHESSWGIARDTCEAGWEPKFHPAAMMSS